MSPDITGVSLTHVIDSREVEQHRSWKSQSDVKVTEAWKVCLKVCYGAKQAVMGTQLGRIHLDSKITIHASHVGQT